MLFHTHHFRDLEPFYLGFICSICVVISRIGFPYNRFVEHQVQVVLRLLLLMAWKALCIQRIHQSEPLRDALCGQYTFGDQDKEEHEEFTDEPV